ERLAPTAQQAAENEGDDDDVVQLAGDGNEVRNEVEGEREVAGERDEQQLLSPWNTWVTEQASAEHDAIGDEAGQPARAIASSGENERQHERGVDEQEDADTDKRPRPDAHVRTVAGGGKSSAGL